MTVFLVLFMSPPYISIFLHPKNRVYSKSDYGYLTQIKKQNMEYSFLKDSSLLSESRYI